MLNALHLLHCETLLRGLRARLRFENHLCVSFSSGRWNIFDENGEIEGTINGNCFSI